jgi:hypothetical protein
LTFSEMFESLLQIIFISFRYSYFWQYLNDLIRNHVLLAIFTNGLVPVSVQALSLPPTHNFLFDVKDVSALRCVT